MGCLPEGERVRMRLGPFSIDNSGKRTYEAYDPGLPAGSSLDSNLLRIPLWIFNPSPSHFRCIAEWSLLNSERLQGTLPPSLQSTNGSGCCCWKGGCEGSSAHPTRGMLATSLAVHFVNSVQKASEI